MESTATKKRQTRRGQPHDVVEVVEPPSKRKKTNMSTVNPDSLFEVNPLWFRG